MDNREYEELRQKTANLEDEIAALRQEQAYLRHSAEARVETISSCIGEHVSIIDRDFTVTWANDICRRFYGRSIIGSKCYATFHGRSEPCALSDCAAALALQDGKRHRREMQTRGRNGKDVYLQGIAQPLAKTDPSDADRVVMVTKNISAMKEAELGLQANMQKLRAILSGIIQAMAMTVESRDAYTAGHQRRVTDFARAVAHELGLDEKQIDGIRMAGVIHDLGKISVPAEILSKPGRINDVEFSLVKNHVQAGYEILKGIAFEWPIADIVLQHHERVNGSGYPRGLAGDEIIMEARVLAVADVVEAMVSHRPYRPALEIKDAVREIKYYSGEYYDMDVVEASARLLTENRYSFQ